MTNPRPRPMDSGEYTYNTFDINEVLDDGSFLDLPFEDENIRTPYEYMEY